MDSLELKRLIKKGESQNLDFKKQITYIHKIAKTIASFANSVGGTLLIGVEDNGFIVGVDPAEEIHLIRQAAEHFCVPSITVNNFIVEDRKEDWRVLVVEVPESGLKPHKSMDGKGEWKVYIRSNDKSLLASKQVIKQLKNNILNKEELSREFSPQEKKMMDYLEKNERITASILSKLVNISDRRSRRILVKLSNEGILYVHDLEKETYYTKA